MLDVINAMLGRMRKKAEGQFDVIIIDEFSRTEKDIKGTNVQARTGFLFPKQGDLIQVARYCLGGSGSVYTPVRIVEQSFHTNSPKVYVDLMDWKIPQIRTIGEKYRHFQSPLAGEQEYVKLQEEERRLRREGLDYELVLVDSSLHPTQTKRMSASGEYKPSFLFNYQIGLSPFPETLNGDNYFGEFAGLKRKNLLVEAVLHPLVGLPKVLLKQGVGKTILD